jgi:formamidopyrimidine-DNA glycosylase
MFDGPRVIASGLFGQGGVAVTPELLYQRLRRDVVNRAGSAGHVVTTLLQQGQEVLVVHADLLGELVYADTHLSVQSIRTNAERK